MCPYSSDELHEIHRVIIAEAKQSSPNMDVETSSSACSIGPTKASAILINYAQRCSDGRRRKNANTPFLSRPINMTFGVLSLRRVCHDGWMRL